MSVNAKCSFYDELFEIGIKVYPSYFSQLILWKVVELDLEEFEKWSEVLNSLIVRWGQQ